MTLTAPTDANDFTQMGVWNPNTVYWGATGSPTGKAYEVEYLGAYWISTYYTNGVAPSAAAGTGWELDTTSPNTPVYTNAVPEAPTGLKTGYVSSTEAVLFWSEPPVEGEGVVSSYNVFENGSLVGTTTGTSFTANGLKASGKYVFSVSANDQFGTSGTTAQWNYQHTVNYNTDPEANPTKTVFTPKTAAATSGKAFSPYFDVTQPNVDFESISAVTKLRSFTLAFMQTNVNDITGGKLAAGVVPTISWGGLNTATLPIASIIQEVKDVSAEGGAVTISIGGYNGTDPAIAAEDYMNNLEAGGSTAAAAKAKAVQNLELEYQSVITTYGVTHLDFDIENYGTVNDTVANGIRDHAVKELEAANPGLSVSYTVAVTPFGLSKIGTGTSSDDYRLLAQAKNDGVTLTTLNIMAMDYGKAENMLAAAKSAATHTEAQLQTLGFTSTKLEVTPMIGQNDTLSDVFTIYEAQQLAAWAKTQSYIAGLGEWEITRDNASSTTSTGTAPTETESGVIQKQYQFSDDLNQVTVATSPAVSGRAGALAQAMSSFGAPAGAPNSSPGVNSGSLQNQMIATTAGPVAHRLAYA